MSAINVNRDWGLIHILTEEYEAALQGRVQTVHTAGMEESSKGFGSNTQENFGMYDLEKYLDTLYPAEGGDDKLAAYVILGINMEGRKEVLSISVGEHKWTMPLRGWAQVYGELGIMYEGRLPE